MSSVGVYARTSEEVEATNPFDVLIQEVHDDAREIQRRYEIHRTARNENQRRRLLDAQFPGFDLDLILQRLEDQTIEPGFVDPRNCLVLWARPTQAVKELIAEVQTRIAKAAPQLWLMPIENLHMTAMEITHSKTAPEVAATLAKIQPKISELVDITYSHRTRLVRPLIGFDASALALSFVPAAGEVSSKMRWATKESYTYHHLRRDLWNLITEAGVAVGSRYVVPSAHLTIGRFITQNGFLKPSEGRQAIDPARVQDLVRIIDQTNAWLKEKHRPHEDGQSLSGGEWIVGEEKGLDCVSGTLWYGNGHRVKLGRGF